MTLRLLFLFSLLSLSSAHVALWHPSMYGFCDGGGGRSGECVNSNNPANPLSDRTFGPPTGDKGWWFHGNMDQPPAPDQFFEFPAGGVIHTELSCNKGQTSWNDGDQVHACGSPGPLHVSTPFTSPPSNEVAGCALAIAYESDPTLIDPSDLVVISTNRTCPWWMHTSFEIPADLPACPEGGCHAFWLWIHAFSQTNGDPYQMYMTPFKAKVTGATNTVPLPKPRLMTKCAGVPGHCVKGPKIPHYWSQKEGNNRQNPVWDPPLFNEDYGLSNGAQKDLYLPTSDLTSDLYLSSWTSQGCHWSPNLNAMSVFYDDNKADVTRSYCIGICDGQGYNVTAVQGGRFCACGYEVNGGLVGDESFCDIPCAGNATEMCGGGSVQSVFTKISTPLPAPPPASLPAVVVASSSSSSSSSSPTSSSFPVSSSWDLPSSSSAPAPSSAPASSSSSSSSPPATSTLPRIKRCLTPEQSALRARATSAGLTGALATPSVRVLSRRGQLPVVRSRRSWF